MSAQWQLGHWMVIADEADGLCVADFVNDVDATSRLFDAEATTCQNFLVALGMQLGETLTEFKFFAINHDSTIGALLPLYGIGW